MDWKKEFDYIICFYDEGENSLTLTHQRIVWLFERIDFDRFRKILSAFIIFHIIILLPNTNAVDKQCWHWAAWMSTKSCHFLQEWNSYVNGKTFPFPLNRWKTATQQQKKLWQITRNAENTEKYTKHFHHDLRLCVNMETPNKSNTEW